VPQVESARFPTPRTPVQFPAVQIFAVHLPEKGIFTPFLGPLSGAISSTFEHMGTLRTVAATTYLSHNCWYGCVRDLGNAAISRPLPPMYRVLHNVLSVPIESEISRFNATRLRLLCSCVWIVDSGPLPQIPPIRAPSAAFDNKGWEVGEGGVKNLVLERSPTFPLFSLKFQTSFVDERDQR
jgi:hypothetical protein